VCYTEPHEDHLTARDTTVVVPLKPNTELPLVLQSIDLSGLRDEGRAWMVYDMLFETFCREAEKLDVHPRISSQDLEAFAPLMNAVEEPIEFRMTPQDLWKLHGAFDAYYWRYRPDCQVSEGVWNILSHAVGNLEGPPE
jgi:hypothetical protein